MAKQHEITRSSKSLKLSADKIIMLPVSDVRPYDKNPRKNADAVKFVKASIEQFGFKVPIIIDSNRVIVCGHTRLLAAKSLGMSEVPCIMADDLTDDQIKAFRLADNKVGEFAEWDMDLLGDELDAIAEACDIDMGDFGFDLSEFDNIGMDEKTEVEEDEVPEEVEPVCKRGDIWQLGEHRLMCGDSTSADDVAKLMNGEMADLLFTDPPYGINVVTKKERTNVGGGGATHFRQGVGGRNIVKGGDYAPVIGDDTTETAKTNYEITKPFTKNQILFGGNYFTDFLPPSRCWIVWDKQNGDNDFADFEMAWCSLDKSARLFKYLWNGLVREGVRDIEGAKRVHPTQKPVGLLMQIIDKMQPDAEKILDCFGGSGSTLIACEQLGRKCRMMELDPHYCDVIIARWEKLTGQKAVKLEG